MQRFFKEYPVWRINNLTHDTRNWETAPYGIIEEKNAASHPSKKLERIQGGDL